MKNVRWSVAGVAALLVGCGGGVFTTLPDDAGGIDAGSDGDVVTDAGPGDASDGDATACATGSIQFVMNVAAGSSTGYCAGTSASCVSDWLSIRPTGGTALSLGNICTTDCTVCEPMACPAICAIPSRVPANGVQQTWNGTSYASSSCGAGISCVNPVCAAPGTYVARMCGFAAPGSDASLGGECAGGGTPTATCVEVPFVWPPTGGTAVVTGTIGAPADGACCPAGWTLSDCAYPDGGAGLSCHDPAKGCASSGVCGQGCDAVVMGRCADGG